MTCWRRAWSPAQQNPQSAHCAPVLGGAVSDGENFLVAHCWRDLVLSWIYGVIIA